MMKKSDISNYINKQLHNYNRASIPQMMHSGYIEQANPPNICKSTMIRQEPHIFKKQLKFCSFPVSNHNQENKSAKPKECDIEARQFHYQDYSSVLPRHRITAKPTLKNIYGKLPSDIRMFKFPEKLHDILSDTNLESIITWLPHGRAFKIKNPTIFTKNVLPMYFQHARLTSFIRQLSSWGFRRITYNQYYHEMFLATMPHLCHIMKRIDKETAVKRKEEDKEDMLKKFHKFCSLHPMPISARREKFNTTTINTDNKVPHFKVEEVAVVKGNNIRRYRCQQMKKNKTTEREKIINDRVLALKNYKRAKIVTSLAKTRKNEKVSMKISREELTAVLAMKELSSSTLI